MTDREKVIKWLEKCRRCECDDCTEIGASQAPWDCPAFDDFVDNALSLLKEQEAKPVIVTTNAYGTRFYHCPRCNRDLCVYPRQLYCSNCGQEVKWDDT